MPSLVAFNRRWNIGSDDFVFPEITESIFRTIWVTLAVSVMIFHFPLSCSVHNMNPHFIALLIINILTIILGITTAVISSRGTVMNSAPRKYVATLLYWRMPIFICEVVWATVSTIHAIHSLRSDYGCHFAVLACITVASEWILIIAVFIGVFAVFHLSEEEVEDNALIARRSWSRRFRIFKIGQDESMRAALDDVAALISTFFVDADLVPSDVLAGLLLAVHSPLNRYPPLLEKSYEDEKPSWMTFQDASYYFHYATSVYGWPSYLWLNLGFRSCCRLYGKLQCCGCRQRGRPAKRTRSVRSTESAVESHNARDCPICNKALNYKNRSMVMEDNCCYCNTAAIVLSTETRNVDLTFMSFRNRLYEVPFSVIVDHDKKSVVIAIRGSCSMMDLITDLCLEDEAMTVDVDADVTLREDEQLDARGEVRVHRGMLRSARYVFDMLRKHNVLEDVLIINQGYGLVVCGHSLGAGVGSLLTILLKQQYPFVHCFSYAPPGCVISAFGEDEMEKYVMSIVSGDDIISRISYQSLHRLRERVFKELNACKKAKHEILIRGFYQLFVSSSWNYSAVGDNDTLIPSTTESYGSAVSEMEQAFEQRETAPEQDKIQLFPPGRILYLHEKDGEFKETWIDARCLNEVKLSASSMSDHLPHNVAKLLEKAAMNEQEQESVIVQQPL